MNNQDFAVIAGLELKTPENSMIYGDSFYSKNDEFYCWEHDFDPRQQVEQAYLVWFGFLKTSNDKTVYRPLVKIRDAQNALKKLYAKILNLKLQCLDVGRLNIEKNGWYRKFLQKFLKAINDDLNMPMAIALMWQMLDDKKLKNAEKYALLLNFDKVFGLGLAKTIAWYTA